MTSAAVGVRRHAAAPDVTVVIPTRDRWDLLRTTLRSVLEQRDVDLEIVIVDDGSRRPRSSVADLDDPRVRVIRHDRSRGVAAARNAGIANATGTWVAFLDDDDVWAPDKLRVQLDAAEAIDAAFAYTGVLQVRDDDGAVALAEPPSPHELAGLLQSHDAIPAGASNVLVRAELVRSVGGFDLDFHHLADWDLWIRLAAAGAGVACPRPLVGYRLHARSMRSTAGGVFRELQALDAKYRVDQPLPEGRIWVYRWLAEGQLLAGQRLSAVATYARGAARCASPSDLRQAFRVALTGEPATAHGEAHRTELKALARDLQWLQRFLPDADLPGDDAPATPAADPIRIRNTVRAIRAVVRERRLRLTSLRAGVALVYHEIGDSPRNEADEVVPLVAPEVFRQQLGHLRTRYRVVPAGELRRAILERRRGERFPVAITFDDDLRSHVDVAMPALAEAGMPATFFLTGASLGGAATFWWERLQRAIDEGVPLEAGNGDPTRALAEIEAMPAVERAAYSQALLDRLGGELPESGLRSGDVAALAEAGHEIGFHTLRHEPLAGLDAARLATAMSDGRDELAAAGGALRAIAYPHGDADARVAAAARAAGFASGFTTEGAAVDIDTDPLLMGRLYPSRASLASFADQLSSAIGRAERPPRAPSAPRKRGRALGRRIGSRLRLRLAGPSSSRVPAVGAARLGDLRRLSPISRRFGMDRGLPIDRYYIEDFLRRHGGSSGYANGEIRGHVCEVGGDDYVRKFGGWPGDEDAPTAVSAVDVLHADASNPDATLVGDLSSGSGVPDERFDCVICTQTLNVVYDTEGVVRTLHRMLKPGGVALVTVPGITQAARPDRDLWGDYWRFTTLSAQRLFEGVFGAGGVRVVAYGNVLTSAAFLYGLAAEELSREELELRDPDYEMLIAIRAQKGESA
jgi:peptidoglycan/xylan/chitin deacetylase (PgdA/CDA1 family)